MRQLSHRQEGHGVHGVRLQTKTGRRWTYVRDDRPSSSLEPPAVWFTYSPDRKGEHPQRHLAGFRGVLQADAYAGSNKLYEDGSIQQAPCMAHIRRKFYELMDARQSPIATEAIERMVRLYTIEKEIRGRAPDQRRRVCQARHGPARLHALLAADIARPALAQAREGGRDPMGRVIQALSYS